MSQKFLNSFHQYIKFFPKGLEHQSLGKEVREIPLLFLIKKKERKKNKKKLKKKTSINIKKNFYF